MRTFYRNSLWGGVGTYFSDSEKSVKEYLERVQPPDQHQKSSVRYAAKHITAIHFQDLTPLVQSKYIPGDFHPRIWRGNDSPLVTESSLQKEFVASVRISRNIFSRLRELFLHVEADHANDCVYGIQERELLILACTEVESAWKSVLMSNGYEGTSDRWKTTDYVKLKRPMKLNEWSVKLSAHPDYGQIKPFEAWDDSRPTQSLAWYDAYNAVKHDRESSLNKATLQSVIEASAALFVMVVAQFGIDHLDTLSVMQADEFAIESVPKWEMEELYILPFMFINKMPPEPLGHPTWTSKEFFKQ